MKVFLKLNALLLLFLALIFAFWRGAATQQGENGRYFPLTGHYIKGEFLEFYESTPDSEFLYGDPITEAFIQPGRGVYIQYLERVRFEYDPTAPEGHKVYLAPLGYFFYRPGEPFPENPNTRDCPTVFEYKVCPVFLEFIEKHGGFERFGSPVAEMQYDGERIFQNFQNFRLEYFPEGGHARQYVRISELGRLAFYSEGEDRERLNADGSYGPEDDLYLQVFVFPVKPLISIGEKQSVFIIVVDQHLSPVWNADVSLFVNYPNQNGSDITVGLTNSSGIAVWEMEDIIGDGDAGIVKIEAKVTFKELEGHTINSFRVSPY